MFLWTREPMESIFPSVQPNIITREFDGGYIEGMDSVDGFEVRRLISTDLRNYLKTEYFPGNIRKR